MCKVICKGVEPYGSVKVYKGTVSPFDRPTFHSRFNIQHVHLQYVCERKEISMACEGSQSEANKFCLFFVIVLGEIA
jgi:hypothetical protein